MMAIKKITYKLLFDIPVFVWLCTVCLVFCVMPVFVSFDRRVCELLFVFLGFVQSVLSFVPRHVLMLFL